jgi:alpha-glucoside transport system substrate-binding protein
VVGVWSGLEQQRFRDVLNDFEKSANVKIEFTSVGHAIATAVEQRLAQGRVPDVVMVPQPGLLRRLAREHRLIPLEGSVLDTVRRNYARVWQRLGSVHGRLYGVWYKAANKSLVWYNVSRFEQFGVVPPRDLPGLISLATEFAQHGIAAFSVGAADGWTLTDWFENIYMRTAGPSRYDQLTAHRISWTDPTVRTALETFGELLSPQTVSGGIDGALRTTFEGSVSGVWQGTGAAPMVFEGDFVGGLLRGAGARLGTDIDVFAFPGRADSSPAVIGGGDAAVLLRRSAAGTAFLRYLAGPRAAAIWASAGGFVSPNLNLDLRIYRDSITRNIARSVVESGDNFRFDLSDQAPAAFGGVEGQGMREALQDFLADRDVSATAAELEAEAVAAYGG